jgi:DNA modification methylase
MSDRQITTLPPKRLRPYPQNAHTHSNKQISQIARSIQQLGFIAPIIADENYVILAGHGRWLAALNLGLGKVPVIVIGGLTAEQKRAYRLADNRLVEKAGWERATLALELSELAPLLIEAGLDIDLTGFEPAEIDLLMADHVDREDDPADESQPIAETVVSRAGDLWLLGGHRMLCGNSCETADMSRLMGRDRVAMTFSDPPYNLAVKSIQGRGKRKHAEFAMASGEMTSAEFVRFLNAAFSLAAKHSLEGSLHYICMDWRHLAEMLAAGKDVFTELINLVVWVKSNGGQGSFYRSQHELIFVFRLGDAPHRNNVELGRHGRNRTNVWTYPGVNTFRTGRLDDLSLHPTVKPVALVADAMRDCTRRGDLVLDLFAGSGTTLLAAERVGRRAYGIEIDPRYVDVAVRRWQAFTGRDAILNGTKKSFDEIAAVGASGKPRRTK